MFIGLSIFMIVMFVLFVAGSILLAPIILLVGIVAVIVLAINKLKEIFNRK